MESFVFTDKIKLKSFKMNLSELSSSFCQMAQSEGQNSQKLWLKCVIFELMSLAKY